MSKIRKKRNNQEFIDDLKKINPSIIALDEFTGTKNRIRFKCAVCDYEWETTPNSVLNGNGCFKCAHKRIAKKETLPHEEFVRRLSIVQPNIEVIGTYTKRKAPIKVKCKICGNVWEKEPDKLLLPIGCQRCKNRQTSFVEQFIYYAFASVLGEEKVYSRDKKLIGQELDIYIPSLGVAFEPGSWIYHKERILKDLEKRNKCAEKNVRLITIYDSYPDVKNPPFENNCYVYKGSLNDVFDSDDKDLISLVEELLSLCNLPSDKLEWKEIRKEAYNACHYNPHETFLNKLRKISPDIEVLEDYVGPFTSIEVNKKTCNHPSWRVVPYSLMQGRSCPYCANNIKKDHEEFIRQLNKINKDIIVLGKYQNSITPIKVKCSTCGREWNATPTAILNGTGCRKCKKCLKKDTSSFVAEMKIKHPTIIVEGEYINSKEKISLKCAVCGYKWKQIPNALVNGRGCPNYRKHDGYHSKIALNTTQFKEKLAVLSPNIEVLGKYVNNKVKIKVKCTICGNEWETSPNTLLRGCGCPGFRKHKNIQSA